MHALMLFVICSGAAISVQAASSRKLAPPTVQLRKADSSTPAQSAAPAADSSNYANCFRGLDSAFVNTKDNDGQYGRMLHRENVFGSKQMVMVSKVRSEGKEDVFDFYVLDTSRDPVKGSKKTFRMPSAASMKSAGADPAFGTRLTMFAVLHGQPEQSSDQRVAISVGRSSAFGTQLGSLSFEAGGFDEKKAVGKLEVDVEAGNLQPLSAKDLEKLLGDRFESISSDVKKPLGDARPCFQTGSPEFRKRLSDISAKYAGGAEAAPAGDGIQ